MPAGRDTAWPEARDARLLALWAQDLSASEIGRKLGVGKNAVVGRLNRLRRRLGEAAVPHRASPIRGERRGGAGAVAQAARRAEGGAAGAAMPVPRLPPLPSAPAVVVPAPVAPPVASRVVAAVGGRCCWPLWGDHARPTHRYCGAPRERGSYCAAHAREAYAPAPARRIEPEEAEALRAAAVLRRQWALEGWRARIAGVGQRGGGVERPW